MMTDEKVLKHYEELKRIYGDEVPNPDHNPILFQFYVKIYKYYHREEYERVQTN